MDAAKRVWRLPAAPKPVGRYQPWVLSGGLLLLAGQLPIQDGQLRFPGRVGAELSVAEGAEAARIAALNALAQIQSALGGNFDRLLSLGRVDGHVSSAPGWFQQPQVLDAASELFLEVLGSEKGAHSRTAFAPSQLPLNAAVKLVVTAFVRPVT